MYIHDSWTEQAIVFILKSLGKVEVIDGHVRLYSCNIYIQRYNTGTEDSVDE